MENQHPHTAEFDAAVIDQWTFKTLAMVKANIALLNVALERGETGSFSALDLDLRGADAQGGTGIMGAVIRTAITRDLIAKRVKVIDGREYPEQVTNDGGNPINSYRLANRHAAALLLSRLCTLARQLEPVIDAQTERAAIQEEMFA
jgi:hypothetical protein